MGTYFQKLYLLVSSGLVEGDFHFGPFSSRRPWLFMIPGVGWIALLAYVISLALRLQLNAMITLLGGIFLYRLGMTDPMVLARFDVNPVQLVILVFSVANILAVLTAPRTDIDLVDEEGNTIGKIHDAMPMFAAFFVHFRNPRAFIP